MTISFVICGLEHTGTTLVSDIFRQVPELDSGFEVGVLLCNTPADFENYQPFADNILKGWGVDKNQFSYCIEAPTINEFYKRLISESSLLPSGTKLVFDKTPRYLSDLTNCLNKTNIPFIATYKDPRAIVHSDYKRSDNTNFIKWYEEYLPGKKSYMKKCYAEYKSNLPNPRVQFVSLENLALDARNSMENIFFHVNQKFSLDYLLLNGLRFKNTKSNSVSIPIAFSYLSDFDIKTTKRIEHDFSEFSDWFYQ